MTMADVERIENEKVLAKLREEQDKALAAAKKAEDAKIAEPIEFKEPEDVEPESETEPETPTTDPAVAKPKKGKAK